MLADVAFSHFECPGNVVKVILLFKELGARNLTVSALNVCFLVAIGANTASVAVAIPQRILPGDQMSTVYAYWLFPAIRTTTGRFPHEQHVFITPTFSAYAAN